jgi:hypothetical protein
MYTVQATVGRGEDDIVFPIDLDTALSTVPRGRRPRFRVTPIALTTYVQEKRINYEMNACLRFHGGTDHLPIKLANVLKEDVKATDIAPQLRKAIEVAGTTYYALSGFPHLQYVARHIDEDYSYFRAILPSHTALYFSERFFLEMLGFDTNKVEAFDEPEPRRSGSTGIVYGFINRYAGLLTINGDPLPEGSEDVESLDVRFITLRTAAKLALPDPADPSVWMDVVFLTKNWLPLELATKRPLNRAVATESLSYLVDLAQRLLNVASEQLQVKATGSREIVIQSKDARVETDPDMAKIDLLIDLSPTLARFLQTEKLLTFPLYDSRSMLFEVRDDFQDDPLQGHYPIHLVAPGQAEVNCAMHGMGTKAVMALMLDPTSFRGEGVVLTGDASELRLRLLDKSLKPVKVRDKTVFCLNMDVTFF